MFVNQQYFLHCCERKCVHTKVLPEESYFVWIFINNVHKQSGEVFLCFALCKISLNIYFSGKLKSREVCSCRSKLKLNSKNISLVISSLYVLKVLFIVILISVLNFSV
jgi:hypothetical protein